MSGAEQMVKQVLERIGPKYETTLVTGLYDSKLPRHDDRGGFEIIRVGIGHKQIDKILYVFLAPFVARGLKPDIVHAIMESYAGGALAILKYIYPKAKRILTLQSGDLDDDEKQKVFYINFFWKAIHTLPNIVTAISTALAARAERLGVKQENLFITPNGLYFDDVPQNVQKIPGQVICVGRLSWEKAHNNTLDAWVEVLKVFPEAKLVFVGEGPEREKIEKQISDLKLGDSVTLTGNVTHDEVLQKMSESEVFVCPSLAEGLGNVFIEAQACGVTPIGTRVGGIPDIIRHEENGLLIEPKNSSQIADSIIRLLKNDALRNKLRSKGLETSRKFEWQGILEKIEGIYEK